MGTQLGSYRSAQNLLILLGSSFALSAEQAWCPKQLTWTFPNMACGFINWPYPDNSVLGALTPCLEDDDDFIFEVVSALGLQHTNRSSLHAKRLVSVAGIFNECGLDADLDFPMLGNTYFLKIFSTAYAPPNHIEVKITAES